MSGTSQFHVRKYILILLMFLVSCVEQEHISVSDIQIDNIYVEADATTLYIDFSVPGYVWEVICPDFDWINISRCAGNDEAHIPIVLTENGNILPRQCCITIKVSKGQYSISKDVFLIQAGKISDSDLGPVINLTGVSESVDGKYYARLTWNKIEDAISYNIYYSRFSTRDFRQLGSPVSVTTMLVDTHNGPNYYYVTYRDAIAESTPSEIIRIYVDNGASQGNWDGKDDSEDNFPEIDDGENPDGMLPVSPVGLSCVVEGDRIKVNWDAVTDASSYKVYRASSSSGAYSLLDVVDCAPYYDKNPLEGYNYYKVSAQNVLGEGSKSTAAYCLYENSTHEVVKPSAPISLTVNNTGNELYPVVTLSWNTVAGASTYKVYRSSSSSSGYSHIGTVAYESYNDDSPLPGKNYYKVSAVNSAGEGPMSSYVYYNYDSSNLLSPAPPQISVTTASTYVSLSWTCKVDATVGKPKEYKVYKQNPETSEYELLTTTKSTSYTDRSVHPGKNWYIVEAINDAGSSINYASSDSVPLARPTSFSASVSGAYITCNWSKVSAATGYQIFVSTSAGGYYSVIADVAGGSTTSKTIYYPASPGTVVYLKVKAYWMGNGYGPEYSDYSSYKKVTF